MNILKIHIILIFVILFFSSCASKKDYPDIKNGIIDLSEWNLDENGHIPLNGEWEFYYNQLLTYQDFRNNNVDLTGLIKVPKNWNKYVVDNKKLTGNGFATYRLRIIPNKNDSVFQLKLKRIDVSYKLWCNDELITQVGNVATNKNEIVPEWKSHTATINSKSDTLNLIIQVANFNHRRGGIIKSILIGTPQEIDKIYKNGLAYDFFLLGLTIIMGIYHIGLYYLRRIDFSTLFFALLCFAVALHLTVVDEYSIKFIFPNIKWDIVAKLDFLGNYLRLTFFAMFLGFMFKKEIHKYFVRVLQILCFIISIFIIVTPTTVFTHTFVLFEIILAVSFIYLIYGLILGIVRKVEGAIYSFIGLVVVLIAIVNDILVANFVISSIYLVPMGILAFIFFQAFMISSKSANAFKRAGILTEELEFANQNLEQKVIERTLKIEQQNIQLQNSFAELNRSKIELEEKNEELMQQSEELRVQTENLQEANKEINLSKNLLENQNKKIELQNKNITDSIIYAQRIQEAILPPISLFEQHFDDYFIMFKPRDIVSGDFYFIESAGDKIFLAVADCTGHGVPGGFMSMLSITLLTEIIRTEKNLTAAEILNELRINLISSLKQDDSKHALNDGLDISLCIINKNTKTINFAGAYHSIFHLNCHNSQPNLKEIKGNKMPIGTYLSEMKSFTDKEINYQKSDIIYLFTDGYKDQYGSIENTKFLNTRFKKLLSDSCAKSSKLQKINLENKIEEWINTCSIPTKQLDDILVLGVKL